MNYLKQMREMQAAVKSSKQVEDAVPPPIPQSTKIDVSAPKPKPAPRSRAARKRPAAVVTSLKEEQEVVYDAANDSDTSSAETQDAVRPLVYADSLKRATEESAVRKKARLANMLDRPAAIHSAFLDAPAPEGTVAVSDFDFGAMSKAPPAPNDSDVQMSEACGGTRPSIIEELAAVAVETKKALGVQQGKANRALANQAVDAFEAKKGRPADYLDAKDIKRTMVKKKQENEKAQSKAKWAGTLDDDTATKIAGPAAVQQNAEVRERVEARSSAEAERRTAARTVVSGGAARSGGAVRADGDASVDASEVHLSGAGKTTSLQSTTPAPGTAQRERVEAQLKTLAERDVVVSEETRSAKLATSVPPALVVQGRHLDSAGGGAVFGDGSTVATPIDFALAPLLDKSQTPAHLLHSALQGVYDKLRRAVHTFYDFYDRSAEDAEMNVRPAAYAKAFEQRVHAEVERMFSDDEKTKNDMRAFLKSLFVGVPPDKRNELLKKKLDEEAPLSHDGAETAEREALVDAVLVGSTPVASNEEDCLEGARRTAVKWQEQAEIEGLERQLSYVPEELLAAQMSYDVRPEDHILLRLIRAHPANDVLYGSKDEEAPISLQRDTETVYEGHHNSVVPEANKLAETLLSTNSFVETLRAEETTSMRTSRMRLDYLIEEGGRRVLSEDDLAEIKTLRESIAAGERAARDAHNAHLVKKYGHRDAPAAIDALYKRNSVALETVPRHYSAQFLREPAGEKYGERPCANELKCICNTLATSLRYAYDCDRSKGGFVCREFLLPSRLARYESEGASALPEVRQACYLCQLYQVTWFFIQNKDRRNQGDGNLEQLQNFKVIFDKEGEYQASVCNLATVLNARACGIVAPFPEFNARFYQYSLCRVTGDDGEMITLRSIEEKLDLVFH